MSWIAFEMLLLGIAFAGVGLFAWHGQDKGDVAKQVPLGAGIVFASAWSGLLGVLIYYHIVSAAFIGVFAPVMLVSLIGFLEDSHKASIQTSLIVQVVAIYSSLYFMNLDFMNITTVSMALSAWMPVLQLLSLVFGVLWINKLMGLMDGMDGLVATQSVCVFGAGSFILYSAGAYELAILGFGLCALLGGFLIWNWPLAKVLMGNSGTCFLGFLMSLFALIGYQTFHIPLEIWIILVSPFWFDASLTLIRRMIAREKFLEPHTKHAYQRLQMAGWSATQVLLGLIALDSILVTLALWAYKAPDLLSLILCADVALLAVIYGLIELAKPMHKNWYCASGRANVQEMIEQD